MSKLTEPLDLFLTHVEIRDHKAIRCGASQNPAVQFVKDQRRAPRADDHITAYVFGRTRNKEEGSYCVEVPYSPCCYMRLPDHFEKHSGWIPYILNHLRTSLIGSPKYAKAYIGAFKGSYVRLRHAIGYRPEKDYLFLKIECSSRFLYQKLKKLTSSPNTFRNPKYRDFYSKFLNHGFLSRLQITPEHKKNWDYKEFFVTHEYLDDVPGFLKSIRLDINNWVRVTGGRIFKNPTRRFSNSQNEVLGIEVKGIPKEEIPVSEMGHFYKCVFDIEAVPADMHSFPKAHRMDKVTHIGTRIKSIIDPEDSIDVTFTLGKSLKSSKSEIRCFDNETQVLNEFIEHVKKYDVDEYVHFNGQDFDWAFLYDRACMASFIQSCSNYAQAHARWLRLRKQHDLFMPHYNAYVELRRDFKKPEEQETPDFKKVQQELFMKMAQAMLLKVPKSGYFWKQPVQTPYNTAIWNIESEAELRELYDYFKPQPSIQPFFYGHRFRCQKSGFDVRAKTSAALGSQLLKTMEDGRCNMDLYLYIKTGPFGLDQFGLEACANTFLGDDVSKMNILDHYTAHPDGIELKHESSKSSPYRMLNEYWMSQKPELNQVVADYCIQDVVVTDQLDDKLGISIELVSMVKRYRVIAYHITQRAQQFRFVTNMSFEIMDRFVLNSYDRTHKAPTYQGAAVLDPKTGLHGGPDQLVFCLDFASLYPTIMRERNLCCSTYILPSDLPRILDLVLKKEHPELLVVPYDREYKLGESPLGNVTSTTPDKNTAYFAVKSIEDTILPRFLERFGNDRGAVKKKMKQCKNKIKAYNRVLKNPNSLEVQKAELETKLQQTQAEIKQTTDPKHKKLLENRESLLKLDLECTKTPKSEIPKQIKRTDFEHMKFDGTQKAIKIGMNSVYGSMGVSRGMITGLQEIAMSITYFGRTYIYKTRDFAYQYAKDTPEFSHLVLEVIYGVRYVVMCMFAR